MNAAGHDARAGSVANARLLGLLACLYFAQGLPSGLLGKALPTLLRDQGVSLAAIGFTTLLALPWALKFLWAPFLDRYATRKRWLLLLNAVTFALMLLLAAQDFATWVHGQLLPLLVVLFCMNLVAATQDIATDGLAVSRLTQTLRGLGNSVQVIGYKIGMILGGGVLLWMVDAHGWQASYAALACLVLLVLLPVLLMRDEPRPAVQAATHTPWQGWRGYARLFADFIARPGLGWWLLAVATFKVGDALASRMIGPMLTDGGLTLAQVGVLTGIVGSVAGVAGALAGGLLLMRLGHQRALLLFGLLQALGLLGYALLDGGQADGRLLFAVVCGEQFADGLSTVALFTLMMDRCRAHSPGTDYSLQASLQVTVTGMAAMASGVLAEAMGYSLVFMAGAALTVCALLPVVMYFRAAARGAVTR
jgi:MFS family permease